MKKPEFPLLDFLCERRFVIKQCGTCKLIRSIEDFYPPTHNGRQKIYINPMCRICSRANRKNTRFLNLERFNLYRLRSYHKITPTEFTWLFEKQNRVCALCLGKQAYNRNNKLVIDHDHNHSHSNVSQKSCRECIRGLLCDGCNLALGMLEPRLHLQNDFVKNYLAQRPFLGTEMIAPNNGPR